MRERAGWSIGILVVLLYALVPVAWITSLSFENPESSRPAASCLSDPTLDNYKRCSRAPPPSAPR